MTTQKHRLRGILGTAVAVTAFMFVTAVPAHAHFLAANSVDGRTIRYDDYTKWDDARIWAINRWNELGSVSIRPDTWDSWADVDFHDTSCSSCFWLAQWQYKNGADDITFNDFYMNGLSTASRRHVALHELGHALGLAHSYEGQVMQAGVGPIQYLQTHDIADYRALWGSPTGVSGLNDTTRTYEK